MLSWCVDITVFCNACFEAVVRVRDDVSSYRFKCADTPEWKTSHSIQANAWRFPLCPIILARHFKLGVRLSQCCFELHYGNAFDTLSLLSLDIAMLHFRPKQSHNAIPTQSQMLIQYA